MTQFGTLAAIWRYPVKSLAPQALEISRIDEAGLPGDRTAALIVRDGHARMGKPYRGKEHNLLHLTDSVKLASTLAAERGVRVSIEGDAPQRYFDSSPVSLIVDRWIAEVESGLQMQLEALRWRPNLYVKTSGDFASSESDLIGCTLQAGTVTLRVTKTIKRCVVTTYDVRTGEQTLDVLDYVANRRANVMGVYCEVEAAGTARVGDAFFLRAR